MADNKMQIFTDQDIIPIENGGTGATTAPDARTALGLGSTTDAVPIVRYEETNTPPSTSDVLDKIDADLFKGNSVIPIANGGTGATTPVWSNPNLLINGDFQVWQRGESFNNVSANTYFADRWVFTPEGGAIANISKGSNGEAIINVTTGGTSSNVRYYMTDEQVKRLAGKKYTLTIDAEVDTDLTVYVGAFNAISISGNQETKKTLYANTRQQLSWNFEITYGSGTSGHIQAMRFNTVGWTGTLKIYGIKLELGEIATPFVPRSYGEELALCQRYYQRLSKPGVIFTVFGRTTSTVNITTVIHHYVPLRTNPTITLDSITWRGNGATGTATTFSSQSNDHRQTRFVVDASVQNNMVYALDITNLALDAEIY